ncbi:hypothetical protein B0T14DRAFT_193216 [Immersiella caudata]|uniref:Uncharacterized protein n=1 Tax=Immersiella caudata TaxID=314043 RepID=A0AA40C3W7_9PEZI|nr:hypothetical protein B0T14DRAFT_193216 [Immersiella caudata]
MPCRQALKSILEVRGKYPLDNFGFADRMKWNLDERRFENDVEELRLGTQRLRETAQAIREARAPRQTQPDTNQTKPICPNGSGCRQPGCGLRNEHPWAATCKDGKDCCAPGCTKFHPKTGHCPNGPTCLNISSCPKAHPWPFHSPQATDGWCQARQGCPGYDGVCPLKHPRKAPCKNGSSCWKRPTCTYDHSPQAPQSQLPAELPAGVHSQDRNRTARVELPATKH